MTLVQLHFSSNHHVPGIDHLACLITSMPDLPFFLLFMYVCMYVCPHWVFVAAHGPSPAAASGGLSLPQCVILSLQWPLPLWSTGSRHAGPSSRGTRTGPVALRHVGSPGTRARTRVPFIGRRVPNNCTTREALPLFFSLINH